jgi:hypothetical protein
MNDIKKSGLYDKVKKIRCGVLAENLDASVFNDEKIEVRLHDDFSIYERFTLNMLHDDSQEEDFDVLYLHTKGITKPYNQCVLDWVNYLKFFNIYKHEDCLKELKKYDAVGVNLFTPETGDPGHYSGNFWWSKSQHIRKLDRYIEPSYTAPEFWLCKMGGNFKSLWSSGVNHYHERYTPDKYT